MTGDLRITLGNDILMMNTVLALYHPPYEG